MTSPCPRLVPLPRARSTCSPLLSYSAAFGDFKCATMQPSIYSDNPVMLCQIATRWNHWLATWSSHLADHCSVAIFTRTYITLSSKEMFINLFAFKRGWWRYIDEHFEYDIKNCHSKNWIWSGNNVYMRIYVYYVISSVPDFVYLFVFIMQPQIS